ncbi:MAG: MarR family winged helix-turn-helix transcriptional regulator [Christensenellales bacterium]
MSQIELCKILGLDKSTVAKTLMRMEDRELITKKVNPADSRSYLVSLTPKATALYPKIKKIHANWMKDVTSEMTAPERDEFFKLMKKVTLQAARIGDG